MASTRSSRATGSQGQRPPSSVIPEALEDDMMSGTPPSPRIERRASSIRFSDDTISRSPISERRHRRTSSTEEVLPIKQADGYAKRNYNTGTATDGQESPEESASSSHVGRQLSGDLSTASQKPEKKISWYKSFAEKYGSVSLENKGSVARDHLALERTFLAWLRTSLAFASIGIAITQLFRLNTSIASRSVYEPGVYRGIDRRDLPFSPLIGHSIPFEAMQALQADTQPTPAAHGSTLLDQLLNPPSLPPFPARGLDSTNSTSGDDPAARLRHVGKPLGATFLGVSIVVLFVGFHRYFEAQHWIIRGKFPASRGSVALVGFIAVALIVTSLVVVLVIAPTSFETKK